MKENAAAKLNWKIKWECEIKYKKAICLVNLKQFFNATRLFFYYKSNCDIKCLWSFSLSENFLLLKYCQGRVFLLTARKLLFVQFFLLSWLFLLLVLLLVGMIMKNYGKETKDCVTFLTWFLLPLLFVNRVNFWDFFSRIRCEFRKRFNTLRGTMEQEGKETQGSVLHNVCYEV